MKTLWCSLLFSLSALCFAAQDSADFATDWRQQVSQQAQWQQYFSRSEQLLQQDRQLLQAELKQLGQSRATKAAKHKNFGFMTQPDPAFWLSAAAEPTALAILSFQTPSGGWSKRTDMASQNRRPGQQFGVEKDYIPTFDNGATSTQILWLHSYLSYARSELKPVLQRAIERAIRFVLEAQYPNGGFAQTYPLRGGYHDAVTLNDDVMLNLLKLLQQVATATDFDYLPIAVRQQAGKQFQRGLDWLLQAQVKLNGDLTVWGAQHDPVSFLPVKARAYELASLVSSESAGITLLLMQLPEPTAAQITSIEAAVRWFKAKQIRDTQMQRSENGVRFVYKTGAKPLWARFYDLQQQHPLFVDRNGKVVSSMEQLSIERQMGYGWYQSKAEAVLKAYPGWKARLTAKK